MFEGGKYKCLRKGKITTYFFIRKLIVIKGKVHIKVISLRYKSALEDCL